MDLVLLTRATDAYGALGDDADRARLTFFGGLYRLEQSWADRVSREFGRRAPSAEQVRAWYWDEAHVLARSPAPIDAPAFGDTLADIAGCLASGAGLDEASADALRSFAWDAFAARADVALAGRDPSAFVERCLSGLDGLGVDAALPAPVFAMVLRCALRPWLQPTAQAVMALAPADQAGHDRPLDCPVCGTPAAASFVGEGAGSDGRGRMQYCAMCGTLWEFERIRCGVCGTRNQRRLHYFNLEGDAAHRIQSCDECGRYQRVVFQDELPGPLCMEVEDVVMAKLDQVALDPRFRREAG